MSEVWDIRDRCPVELPDLGEGTVEGEELLASSAFRQNVELDRYERAVSRMPPEKRRRFLRSMQTASAIMGLVRCSG